MWAGEGGATGTLHDAPRSGRSGHVDGQLPHSSLGRVPRDVHLVAAAVAEVGAIDPVVLADEGVVPVPLAYAEVDGSIDVRLVRDA